MSKYKKEHDRLSQQLSSLPAETSFRDRQAVEKELGLLQTNELRRQARKAGFDLDKAAVGPWTSDADNPKLTWLEAFRQPEARELIKATRSARRKERRDLVIKLAPIVISLLALILTFYFRAVDKKPSAAPTDQGNSTAK